MGIDVRAEDGDIDEAEELLDPVVSVSIGVGPEDAGAGESGKSPDPLSVIFAIFSCSLSLSQLSFFNLKCACGGRERGSVSVYIVVPFAFAVVIQTLTHSLVTRLLD